MNASKRRKAMERKNRGGKTIALGLLERGGSIRTEVVEDRERPTLQGKIREHVELGSVVLTDELHSYYGLDADYAHKVINHAYEYAKGYIHTNGLENFWSLLKRGLSGTYVSVAPFHLFRYLDEQAYRYNNRKDTTDEGRFLKALSQIAGKRLTYDELTGQVAGAF
jgi:transposase-like protein